MNMMNVIKKVFSKTEEIRIEIYEHKNPNPVKIYEFEVPVSNAFLNREFSEFYSEYMEGIYTFISKTKGYKKSVMKFYIN